MSSDSEEVPDQEGAADKYLDKLIKDIKQTTKSDDDLAYREAVDIFFRALEQYGYIEE